MRKYKTTLRLSKDELEILEQLSNNMHLPKSHVLRIALVRLFAYQKQFSEKLNSGEI